MVFRGIPKEEQRSLIRRTSLGLLLDSLLDSLLFLKRSLRMSKRIAHI